MNNLDNLICKMSPPHDLCDCVTSIVGDYCFKDYGVLSIGYDNLRVYFWCGRKKKQREQEIARDPGQVLKQEYIKRRISTHILSSRYGKTLRGTDENLDPFVYSL